MMSILMRAAGIGVAAAVAAGAAAAGVAAERVSRNRRSMRALDPEDGFEQLADEELVIIASDGVALHVEIDTPQNWNAEVPTVVLSHGFTLSLESLVLQRRALVAAGYRVVLWDQRSHGRSQASDLGHTTMTQLGIDLHSVIEAVCPEGQLVLVGHSMGGMTVMSLARSYPELVRDRVIGIVLLSTAAAGAGLTELGFGSLVGRSVGQLGPRVLTGLAPHQRIIRPVRRMGRTLEDAVVYRYSFDSPVSDELLRFSSDLIFATPLEVMAAFILAIRSHDESATLGSLREREVLILNGAGDRLTPPIESLKIAKKLPNAQHVVVRDAGHLVMLEHPDLVNSAILALMTRARTAAASTKRPQPRSRVREVVTDITRAERARSARAASKTVSMPSTKTRSQRRPRP